VDFPRRDFTAHFILRKISFKEKIRGRFIHLTGFASDHIENYLEPILAGDEPFGHNYNRKLNWHE
ncbi:unnamed protein product, partial [Allacma fusca]